MPPFCAAFQGIGSRRHVAVAAFAPEAFEAAGGADEDDASVEGAVVLQGARVFRRERSEHNRIFKWGVGSKWRMESKNRLVPVHKPHPKEVMVRDDYYESDNPNVSWEPLNESWEVYWYEHTKLNAKPFPVKKYGVERAKVEAMAFLGELEVAGRTQEKPQHEQPQPGVFYDGRIQAWVSLFWRGGRPLSRTFSATKYGYDGARALAVAKQNDPAAGVLPARSGGGTPLIDKPLSKAAAIRRARG